MNRDLLKVTVQDVIKFIQKYKGFGFIFKNPKSDINQGLNQNIYNSNKYYDIRKEGSDSGARFSAPVGPGGPGPDLGPGLPPSGGPGFFVPEITPYIPPPPPPPPTLIPVSIYRIMPGESPAAVTIRRVPEGPIPSYIFSGEVVPKLVPEPSPRPPIRRGEIILPTPPAYVSPYIFVTPKPEPSKPEPYYPEPEPMPYIEPSKPEPYKPEPEPMPYAPYFTTPKPFKYDPYGPEDPFFRYRDPIRREDSPDSSRASIPDPARIVESSGDSFIDDPSSPESSFEEARSSIMDSFETDIELSFEERRTEFITSLNNLENEIKALIAALQAELIGGAADVERTRLLSRILTSLHEYLSRLGELRTFETVEQLRAEIVKFRKIVDDFNNMPREPPMPIRTSTPKASEEERKIVPVPIAPIDGPLFTIVPPTTIIGGPSLEIKPEPGPFPPDFPTGERVGIKKESKKTGKKKKENELPEPSPPPPPPPPPSAEAIKRKETSNILINELAKRRGFIEDSILEDTFNATFREEPEKPDPSGPLPPPPPMSSILESIGPAVGSLMDSIKSFTFTKKKEPAPSLPTAITIGEKTNGIEKAVANVADKLDSLKRGPGPIGIDFNALFEQQKKLERKRKEKEEKERLEALARMDSGKDLPPPPPPAPPASSLSLETERLSKAFDKFILPSYDEVMITEDEDDDGDFGSTSLITITNTVRRLNDIPATIKENKNIKPIEIKRAIENTTKKSDLIEIRDAITDSNYITREMKKELLEDIKGEFTGPGYDEILEKIENLKKRIKVEQLTEEERALIKKYINNLPDKDKDKIKERIKEEFPELNDDIIPDEENYKNILKQIKEDDSEDKIISNLIELEILLDDPKEVNIGEKDAENLNDMVDELERMASSVNNGTVNGIISKINNKIEQKIDIKPRADKDYENYLNNKNILESAKKFDQINQLAKEIIVPKYIQAANAAKKLGEEMLKPFVEKPLDDNRTDNTGSLYEAYNDSKKFTKPIASFSKNQNLANKIMASELISEEERLRVMTNLKDNSLNKVVTSYTQNRAFKKINCMACNKSFDKTVHRKLGCGCIVCNECYKVANQHDFCPVKADHSINMKERTDLETINRINNLLKNKTSISISNEKKNLIQDVVSSEEFHKEALNNVQLISDSNGKMIIKSYERNLPKRNYFPSDYTYSDDKRKVLDELYLSVSRIETILENVQYYGQFKPYNFELNEDPDSIFNQDYSSLDGKYFTQFTVQPIEEIFVRLYRTGLTPYTHQYMIANIRNIQLHFNNRKYEMAIDKLFDLLDMPVNGNNVNLNPFKFYFDNFVNQNVGLNEIKKMSFRNLISGITEEKEDIISINQASQLKDNSDNIAPIDYNLIDKAPTTVTTVDSRITQPSQELSSVNDKPKTKPGTKNLPMCNACKSETYTSNVQHSDGSYCSLCRACLLLTSKNNFICVFCNRKINNMQNKEELIDLTTDKNIENSIAENEQNGNLLRNLRNKNKEADMNNGVIDSNKTDNSIKYGGGRAPQASSLMPEKIPDLNRERSKRRIDIGSIDPYSPANKKELKQQVEDITLNNDSSQDIVSTIMSAPSNVMKGISKGIGFLFGGGKKEELIEEKKLSDIEVYSKEQMAIDSALKPPEEEIMFEKEIFNRSTDPINYGRLTPSNNLIMQGFKGLKKTTPYYREKPAIPPVNNEGTVNYREVLKKPIPSKLPQLNENTEANNNQDEDIQEIPEEDFPVKASTSSAAKSKDIMEISPNEFNKRDIMEIKPNEFNERKKDITKKTKIRKLGQENEQTMSEDQWRRAFVKKHGSEPNKEETDFANKNRKSYAISQKNKKGNKSKGKGIMHAQHSENLHNSLHLREHNLEHFTNIVNNKENIVNAHSTIAKGIMDNHMSRLVSHGQFRHNRLLKNVENIENKKEKEHVKKYDDFKCAGCKSSLTFSKIYAPTNKGEGIKDHLLCENCMKTRKIMPNTREPIKGMGFNSLETHPYKSAQLIKSKIFDYAINPEKYRESKDNTKSLWEIFLESVPSNLNPESIIKKMKSELVLEHPDEFTDHDLDLYVIAIAYNSFTDITNEFLTANINILGVVYAMINKVLTFKTKAFNINRLTTFDILKNYIKENPILGLQISAQ